MSNAPSRKISNGKIAAICGGVVVAMVGAGFAAVPLYQAFCQVTGFGGTVSQATAEADRILDREVKVRFDANTNGVPWTFRPEQVSQNVRIGETKLAYFTVTNDGDAPMTGQATFNVVPETVGGYFKKLECFCFEEQTIAAGETVEYAVVYFVDPEFDSDPETRPFTEITLSYTFFPSRNGAIEQASLNAANAPLGEGVQAGL